MTVRLRAAGGVLALAFAVTLSGCSGDDSSDAGSADSSDAAASVDPGQVSPTDLPEVPEVGDSAGAIADASFGSCTADPGTQRVEGSLTSTAKKTRDYVVTVSWVNDSSDVLTRAVAVIKDLEPGESEDFTLTAQVPDGATVCTFHVVRGTID